MGCYYGLRKDDECKGENVMFDIQEYRKELENALSLEVPDKQLKQLLSEDESYRKLLDMLSDIVEDAYLHTYKAPPFPFADLGNGEWKRQLIGVLKEIAGWRIPPFVAAKICDFLWVKDKDRISAVSALDLYLRCLSEGIPGRDGLHCFYRIVSIRLSTKGKQAEFSDLASLFLDRFSALEDDGHRLKMVELAKEIEILPDAEYLQLVEEQVEHLKTDPDQNVRLIERYAELYEKKLDDQKGAGGSRVLDRNARILRMRRIVVDSLVSAARIDRPIETGRLAYQEGLLKRAIFLLRRIPGTEEERKELITRRDEVQRALVGKMELFSHPVDLSKQLRHICGLVSELNKEESLFYLAWQMEGLRSDVIRESVMQKKNSLMGMFRMNILDSEGRTVAILQPFRDGEEGELIVYQHMIHSALTSMDACGFVLQHTLHTIERQHRITETDIRRIVEESLFVPERRRKSFTKGILAGFQRDYMTALYILVPQFENSIRELVKACDEPVYNIKDDGTEEVKTLNGIADLPKVKEVFDEEMLFAIHAIFCSQYGLNIRNEQGHGLVDDNFYESRRAVFVWWYIFSICYQMRRRVHGDGVRTSVFEKISKYVKENLAGSDEEEVEMN